MRHISFGLLLHLTTLSCHQDYGEENMFDEETLMDSEKLFESVLKAELDDVDENEVDK